jgi:hypothetical protein
MNPVEALAAAMDMLVGFFMQPEARPAAVLHRSRVLTSARREATRQGAHPNSRDGRGQAVALGGLAGRV